MRRFLLAWEFGGDLGHVRRQCAFARRLRDRGHEVLLAFSDVAALGEEALAGIDWVQAPALPLAESPDPSPLNASDILLNLGFAHAGALAGALTAWNTMLRLWQPHVVVADYAPTALLAARRERIARVTVGSGFSIPPAGDPLPALRGWIPTDTRLLAERDARVVAAVRKACERLPAKVAAPERARELFEADAHLICSWPELDPFGPREGVAYVGPQSGDADLPAAQWRSRGRSRILAYLKPRDPRFPALIAGLASAGAEAIVAAPGLSSAEAQAASQGDVRVLDHAVNLPATLEGVDLFVSHGGPGSVAAAAAAGVPMALLPMHLEQFLVARRVETAGQGLMLPPDVPTPDLGAWLRAALGRADLRSAATNARPAASRPALDGAAIIERSAGV